MASDGESLEETLAFLDEALRESDAILSDDDQNPLDTHLFATLGGDIDQDLGLFTANETAGPQQASSHSRHQGRGRRTTTRTGLVKSAMLSW